MSVLIDRIQQHAVQDGDCWTWRGCISGSVPVMKYGPQSANVRRLVLIDKGVPMKGYVATFTCGNPKCVNPDHVARTTKGAINKRIMNNMSSAANALRSKRIAEAKRATQAKLSLAEVQQIRESTETHKQLSARLGVAANIIGRIKRGEMWREYNANPFSALY